MNRFAVTTAVAAVVLWATGAAFGWDPSPPAKAEPAGESGTPGLTSPAAQQAAAKGLTWLAKRQDQDGSYSSGRFKSNVAITGLAGLVFLSEGSAPGRGKYRRNVEKCAEFIVASTNEETGLIAAGKTAGPMYGHGFAALFLAKALAHTDRAELREKLAGKLALAVGLTVKAQGDSGGWRYTPVPQDGDISVTSCQLMALRAARDAGIEVPEKTVRRGIDYVRRSQNEDGGFKYTLRGGGSALPRSAAALAVLRCWQHDGDRVIEKAGKYVARYKAHVGRPRRGHFFYTHYYAVQAFRRAGGDQWKEWYPAIRDRLVESQQADGSWKDQVGPEYATAMALIVLQHPKGALDPPGRGKASGEKSDKNDCGGAGPLHDGGGRRGR